MVGTGETTSRRLRPAAYPPQFKSRVFYSLYRFQKLVKKMPFNNILPQVQSINIDAFLASARFPKQNTIEVMAVNGMFLLSCRKKMWANFAIDSVFLIDTFFVLFRSFSGQ